MKTPVTLVLAVLLILVVAAPLGSQPNAKFDSMTFGTSSLRIGMTKDDVTRVLTPAYRLKELGPGPLGSSFMIITTSGPPYDAPGSLYFDSNGFLRSMIRDWSPSDQQAGVLTAEALYNALTHLIPGESHRVCDCSLSLDIQTSPSGESRSVFISNGNKTIAVSIVQNHKLPGSPQAVTVDERVER